MPLMNALRTLTWGIAALSLACTESAAGVPSPSAGGSADAAGGGAGDGLTAGTGARGGLGGAGGSIAPGGAGGGGAAGSGGVAGAAGAAGAAGMAGDTSLNQLAEAFRGLRMDLKCDHPQEQPCEPQNSAMPNRGYICCYVDETIERKNLPPVDKELSFGGDPAKVYDVELRIRGVMENHDYGAQGTKQGKWVLVGGALPKPGAIHVFGFTVHDPDETYFFNSWNDTSDPARIIAMDYTVTLGMRGGTKVRVFEYDDIGKIWANAEGLKLEGLPPYPDAFDGQFMHVDVLSVNARP